MRITGLQIDSLLEIILKNTAIDLSEYRRPTLTRRISGHLARLGMSAEQLLSICRDDPEECRRLVNTVSINVSSFFRDPIVFDVIASHILPALCRKKKDLRVWSAGCASGEEAYSIAILIRDELERTNNSDCEPRIFATDIDETILVKARKAIYPRESLKSTQLGVADACFSPVTDGFELCPEVRQMVRFSTDDLLSRKTDSPAESIYGGFDIILCRNVLIYFSDKNQLQTLEQLYRSLAKGGYLVLGDSEAICRDLKSRFKTVDARNKIYQR